MSRRYFDWNRRTALGPMTDLLALLLVVFGVAKVVFGGVPDRYEGPALIVLIVVALSGHVARRAAYHGNEAARAAKRALGSNEERLSLALDFARMGAWTWDDETGERTWTKGLFDILGIEESAAPGIPALNLEDSERIRSMMEESRHGSGEFEIDDIRVVQPNGEMRKILTRGRWIEDAGGRRTRAAGIAVDVTERRFEEEKRSSLEEQLQQVHRLESLGRLAGGIAHDFNNLLLALRGYAELALRALDRKDDPREDIAGIISSTEKASTLTKQLLAFSRRQILQPEVQDLEEVVLDMQRLLMRIIGEDIEFETSMPDAPVFVNVDRSQLEQIIVNLAVNARDAMPDGGKVLIELSYVCVGGFHTAGMPPGDYAVLAVSDTGCGMDDETVAQIFEPFFTTKDGIGTGLGLATVHGIVKQSGGFIWVYSEPDRGTTFKIYFPVVSASPAEKRNHEDDAVAHRAGTVLLVEDDPHVRTIIDRMLTENGYDVLSAKNGNEALSLVDTNDFDLLVTDVVMPGLNGRETAQLIRAAKGDIPVLYMSGYTDDGIFRRGVLEEGTPFIQKPFTAEELLRRAREVVDTSRAAA